MARLSILLFFLFFYQFEIQFALCNEHDIYFFDICKPSKCNETSSLEIRFPYRLDSSPPVCGLPGLELTCSSNNDTLITFTDLGSKKVQSIDYEDGSITVDLGDSWPSCILKNLTLLQEKMALLQNLTMMNQTTLFFFQPVTEESSLFRCPKRLDRYTSIDLAGPVSCLSSAGKYVYLADATDFMDIIPPECVALKNNVSIFVPQRYGDPRILNDFLVRRLMTLEYQYLRPSNIIGESMYYNITEECMYCKSHGGWCGLDITRNEPFCKHHHNMKVKIISATSAAAFVLLLSIPAVLFYLSRKSSNEKETRLKVELFLATYKITKPTRYTFNELKKITKRFNNKLGQGGFGSVYKGELSIGLPVAVKLLERSKGAGEEFLNEVATIGRIHHFNIVRLIGFCSEGTRRALVYEFMPNNSLDKYVVRRKNTSALPLGMENLLQIAIGIARGIEYLHQGCNEQILHFDIKPHNILLDENLNPKIADFGLAKLCAKDQSVITMTAARGTMGYIAPEVYSRNFGTVSYKSDVYSFGMLLLEMVVGKKSADPEIDNQSDEYFPELVYGRLVLGHDLQLEVQMSSLEAEIVKKLIVVAFWCIQWNPTNRPSMTRVLYMLMDNLQNIQMPPKPFVSSTRFENSPTV